MLDIKIFDVDYGFCAALTTGDHHTVLMDFGYSTRSGFNPRAGALAMWIR